MKKALVVLAVLVVAAVTVHLATPRVLEVLIERDCSQPEPSEACLTRMRAMGHLWSKRHGLVRAKHWYGRAAEQGDAAAMFHLAWVHEELALGGVVKGLREEADRIRASRFARKSDAAAPPVELDGRVNSYLELARAWYRRSAEHGFAPGMNNLGQTYLSGWGGPQDYEAAFRWHLAAARAGNPVGRMNVALAYAGGQGVAPDEAAAVQWSSWMPNAARPTDLLEPTFARTRLFGTSLPAGQRELLRAAAGVGTPITLKVRPLEPDPSLPTFRETEEALPNRRP